MQTNKCNTAYKQNQKQESNNHLNRCKKKKGFYKIQCPVIYNLEETRNRRTYHNIIKTVYVRPITNIKLNGENLKAFILKSGETNLSTIATHSMCLNLRIIKQKKKIKGIHVREE
jgi:hypothetical protein